ncbi:hypothetical protein HDU67_004635 [Dinochytrium kinnereticum]|nr:hypothetical protein HDU67_004635 [Dinochytrium kinnereticum]
MASRTFKRSQPRKMSTIHHRRFSDLLIISFTAVSLLLTITTAAPTSFRSQIFKGSGSRTAIPNRYIVQLQDTPKLTNLAAESLSLQRQAKTRGSPETVMAAWDQSKKIWGNGVEDYLAKFMEDARMAGVSSLKRSEGFAGFRRIFTGMVVDVKVGEDVEKLKGLHGVKRLIPVHRVSKPNSKIHWIGDVSNRAPTPNLRKRLTHLNRRDNKANDMTNITTIINTPGDPRGKGIRVCVIDTGVDYTHPALGGCFGKGCKVAFGYDFVGDEYDPASENITVATPTPKEDPMDCWGHGTHVSGIIAADDVENKGATGVAPGATLGVLFGCNGDSDTASILSAMDRSFFDNCNILNLSLGAGSSWSDTPDALLADLLGLTGEIIVSSVGNDQDMGAFQVNSPAVGLSTTGVGAVENWEYPGRTFSVVNDTSARMIPFTFPVGRPPNTTMASIKASEPLNATAVADGCRPYPANFFAGHYALIRRGTCIFTQKIRNAHNASALGVIIYNRLPEPLGEITSPLKDFPVHTISGADGQFLLTRLIQFGNKGNVSIEFNSTETYFPVPGAGSVAGFSSWGPALDWRSKPDLVAPGGNMLSTWLVKDGKYAVLSGTSMASPFVAGSYALFLSSLPDYELGATDPLAIKSALLTTSTPTLLNPSTRGYITPPQNTTLRPPSQILSPVALQGSGLLNVSAAINASTFITPTSLPGNVSTWSSTGEAASRSFNVSIWNDDVTERVYGVWFEEAALVGLDEPADPVIYAPVMANVTKGSIPESSIWSGSTRVVIQPDVLRVPPGSRGFINITITAPSKNLTSSINSTQKVWLYNGYIRLKDDLSNTFTIPFLGVVGDFSSQNPLDTTGTTQPFLSPLSSLLPNASTRPTQLSQNNVTVNFTATLPPNRVIDPPKPESLTVNIHLRLPSPKVRIFVFPVTVTTDSMMKLSQQAVSSFDDTVIPLGAVAASPAAKLAVNDKDDAKTNLFTSLMWDGSVDFLSGVNSAMRAPPPSLGGNRTVLVEKPKLVKSGDYRIVVTIQSVYGNNGVWGGWVSPIFKVFTGV